MARRRKGLQDLVESYFVEHLQRVRGASEHTVHSYRDALRLFLLFLATKARCPLSKLTLEAISAGAVLAFLDHIEATRTNCASTRNHRLAVIRSFAQHLMRHDIERAAQYHRILALPSKKARMKPMPYLEPQEAKAIIDQPDRRNKFGARDHALLLFLYNTGARVSEALQVRRHQLHLSLPRQVRLLGKGGKERICPLWPETATALQLLLDSQPGTDALFQSARGSPLTRDGVAYILGKYVASAIRSQPSLRRARISPHVFRHSCAVALLQAGVDVSVIRDYLGHASVATTSRYITTNLETKRVALEAFWDHAGIRGRKDKVWRAAPGLLRFLDSL